MSELTQAQLKTLIINFYAKVRKDDLLGPVFNDVAKVNWDHHIPLLCKFWNSVMLGAREYHGNAYGKHIEISKKILINDSHFERWLMLFKETAESTLSVEHAKEIVRRANLIAESLKHGMLIQ